MINAKRAYEAAAPSDGSRFLVDHLWPRGRKKEELEIVDWVKEVSPSNELRQWFNHDPAKWNEFQRRYFAELEAKPEKWKPLLDASHRGNITLVYAARDTEHNNAVALKDFLEKHPKSAHPTPARPSSQ